MKRHAIAVLLLICTTALLAEDKLSQKYVKVTGTAEVRVAPDQVTIDVGVEKHNPSAILAKQMADEASRKLISVVRSAGIEAKDVQTTNLSLQPRIEYHDKTTNRYFSAEQTLSITLRDISKLDTLLESLIKAGGNRIDSIQYGTSDLRRYRDQARDLASKAAREKAEALARGLGQAIGKPLSIEELAEPVNVYANAGLANVSFSADKMRSPNGPSTAAGENSVSASVVVSFELN